MSFLLAEAFSFSEKRSFQLELHSFQQKPFLLVEAISSNGGHSFQREPFFQQKLYLLIKVVSFSGSRSIQSKLILLVEAIPFGEAISCSENITCDESRSFQLKLFLLVEVIPFIGDYSFQWNPFLLVEAIPFSGSRVEILIRVVHRELSQIFKMRILSMSCP